MLLRGYLCWQELERLGLDDAVDLHVCEVPVEYQAVQKLLPSLWREHQPQVCEKTHHNVHLKKKKKETPSASPNQPVPLLSLGSCRQLVVHVGVSGSATTVTLEQCGHNKGYGRPDNCSFCPVSHCCVENGPDCIRSLLDMNTVCTRVNGSDLGVTLSVSEDAGR